MHTAEPRAPRAPCATVRHAQVVPDFVDPADLAEALTILNDDAEAAGAATVHARQQREAAFIARDTKRGQREQEHRSSTQHWSACGPPRGSR